MIELFFLALFRVNVVDLHLINYSESPALIVDLKSSRPILKYVQANDTLKIVISDGIISSTPGIVVDGTYNLKKIKIDPGCSVHFKLVNYNHINTVRYIQIDHYGEFYNFLVLKDKNWKIKAKVR
jgi:hypothetical protein